MPITRYKETLVTPPVNRSWQSIDTDGSGNLVTVNVGSGGQPRTARSSNYGDTWVSQNASQNNPWSSVSYNSNIAVFAAVALNGTARAMTSSNAGASWSNRTQITSNNSWESIAFSPTLNQWAACASNGSSSNCISTSTSETGWISRSLTPEPWRRIVWGRDRFIVLPNGTGNAVYGWASNASGVSNWSTETTPILFSRIIWCNEIDRYFGFSNDNNDQFYWSDRDLTSWTLANKAQSENTNWIGYDSDAKQAIAISATGRIEASINLETWVDIGQLTLTDRFIGNGVYLSAKRRYFLVCENADSNSFIKLDAISELLKNSSFTLNKTFQVEQQTTSNTITAQRTFTLDKTFEATVTNSAIAQRTFTLAKTFQATVTNLASISRTFTLSKTFQTTVTNSAISQRTFTLSKTFQAFQDLGFNLINAERTFTLSKTFQATITNSAISQRTFTLSKTFQTTLGNLLNVQRSFVLDKTFEVTLIYEANTIEAFRTFQLNKTFTASPVIKVTLIRELTFNKIFEAQALEDIGRFFANLTTGKAELTISQNDVNVSEQVIIIGSSTIKIADNDFEINL